MKRTKLEKALTKILNQPRQDSPSTHTHPKNQKNKTKITTKKRLLEDLLFDLRFKEFFSNKTTGEWGVPRF